MIEKGEEGESEEEGSKEMEKEEKVKKKCLKEMLEWVSKIICFYSNVIISILLESEPLYFLHNHFWH